MAGRIWLASRATDRFRVTNVERETILAEEASRARSFVARLLGLMGRRALPPGSGLLIEGDNAIHTCFMRFAIDVVFLDSRLQVLDLAQSLPPWRVGRIVWRAKAVLELPPGTVARTRTQMGDQLLLGAVTR